MTTILDGIDAGLILLGALAAPVVTVLLVVAVARRRWSTALFRAGLLALIAFWFAAHAGDWLAWPLIAAAVVAMWFGEVPDEPAHDTTSKLPVG